MKSTHHRQVLAILLASSAFLAPSAAPLAQQPVPTLKEMRLSSFVDAASARAHDYFVFFRDITAEETKTVEQFRENGEVSRRRTIVSDLIVYRSVLDNGSISEYRDVKSVDGAPVAGREERVQALFARQARSKSVRDELKRVNAEGSRYDLDYTVSGLTMSQGLPLQVWARALFTFKESGAERIDGRETLILSYQQVVPNSRFGFNLSLPSELRAGEPLFRGWVWLEPVTGRLVREIREVTVLSAGTNSPVVVQRLEFKYAQSRFDVLLPTTIVFSSLGHFAREGSGFSSSVKYRLTFRYGEFRRFTATSDDTELASTDLPDGNHAEDERPSAPVVAERREPGGQARSDADLGPEFGPDAPLGPPVAAAPEAATSPARPNGARRSGAPPAPRSTSVRLTVEAGLPASAAVGIELAPLPSFDPSKFGAPPVQIPPPPLAPGEKPKYRPPPS